MKNRVIITISDIYGSTQYTVHGFLRQFFYILLLFATLIGIGTFLYIKLMNGALEHLVKESQHYQDEIEALQKKSVEYKTKNLQLNQQNEALIAHIEESNEKLGSLHDKLQEVEETIGIGPDIDDNSSFKEQLEQANTLIQKQAIQEQLSTIQKAILLNSIPNGKPIDYERISSGFGYRFHPITHQNSFHPAIDLTASTGTPVYATANGVVVFAKSKSGYGNFVIIAHAFGFKTGYAHLEKIAVSMGEYISKGDVVGYVGTSGRTTGPHLHYEVRYLERWLNPLPFIEWNLEEMSDIRYRVTRVDWRSILKQTKQLITLSNETKEIP